MRSEQTQTVTPGRFASLGLLALGVIGVLGPAAVGAQDTTDDPAKVEAGKLVFESTCAGCHSVDGTGSVTGRPLTGIADQQPDRLVNVKSVTGGKGGMPAFGSELSGDEIDAAVTYVRLTFVGGGAIGSLPRTGRSPVLPILAGSMIGVGVTLNEVARRRRPALG